MQYALLIYSTPGSPPELPPAEADALTAEYMAIRQASGVLGGNHLAPVESATTIRADGTQMLSTDGPFADTKEILAGYFLVEADDIDAALALAGRIPALRFGGAVEVRPIVEYDH
jgi:hypothetical protein